MALGLSLLVGVANCVIPPQTQAQPVPWGAPSAGAQPAGTPAPGATAATPPGQAETGSCQDACAQLAACEIAPYGDCLGACGNVDPAQLEAIANTSCEDLAATLQASTASQPDVATAYTPSMPTALSGAWVSTEWASYTNPAMVSADFYLTITVGEDGRFRGSWARYICLTQAYGVMSCGMDRLEGSASGQLASDGTGVIELERVGRSALQWTAKSSTEVVIQLPQDWQGDRILFRSTIKR